MADIFDEMTKEEIVQWARKRVYPRMWPKKSDMLCFRWDIGVKKLQHRMDANRIYFKTINLERHDALAREFNKEPRVSRKQKLLKEIMEIDRQVKAWSREETAIMAADRKLDKIYQASRREREKEAALMNGSASFMDAYRLGEREE